MLDERDINIIAGLFEASEARMTEKIETSIAESEARITEKLEARMDEKFEASEARMTAKIETSIAESEARMTAAFETRITQEIKASERRMTKKIKASETTVMDEIDRTHNIVLKQLANMQKQIDGVQQSYKLVEMNAEQYEFILNKLDQHEERLERLERRTGFKCL